MLYRIIIAPVQNSSDWRVAVNTQNGTILETIVFIRNGVAVIAVVEGYLQMWKGEIEIHPGKSSEYYRTLTHYVNSWKGTL